MRLKRQTLAEVTIMCFGPDLGGHLLDRGAVHPILGADRKKPGFDGHHLPYRDITTTKFEVLGLTAGEISGLTVWDFDTHDLELPVDPNVRTSRGAHIYTPYAGESHYQAGVREIDVISNGNVVFWDSNVDKAFEHGQLADSLVMHRFWEALAGVKIKMTSQQQRTGTRISSSYKGGRVTSTRASQCADSYPTRVEKAGYSIDVVSIQRGAMLQMRAASDGNRNKALHRKSVELMQCEIDPWCLEGPAQDTGLNPGEVSKTIEAVVRTFNGAKVPEVMHQAQVWATAARATTHPRMHDLIDGVARLAIEQNSLSPMVTQSRLSATVNRSTTSRRLDRLVEIGLLLKKPMGTRPDGRVRSNCYLLRGVLADTGSVTRGNA